MSCTAPCRPAARAVGEVADAGLEGAETARAAGHAAADLRADPEAREPVHVRRIAEPAPLVQVVARGRIDGAVHAAPGHARPKLRDDVSDVGPIRLHEVRLVRLCSEVERLGDVGVARIEERQVRDRPLERRLVHLARAGAVEVRARPPFDEELAVLRRVQRDKVGRGRREREQREDPHRRARRLCRARCRVRRGRPPRSHERDAVRAAARGHKLPPRARAGSAVCPGPSARAKRCVLEVSLARRRSSRSPRHTGLSRLNSGRQVRPFRILIAKPATAVTVHAAAAATLRDLMSSFEAEDSDEEPELTTDALSARRSPRCASTWPAEAVQQRARDEGDARTRLRRARASRRRTSTSQFWYDDATAARPPRRSSRLAPADGRIAVARARAPPLGRRGRGRRARGRRRARGAARDRPPLRGAFGERFALRLQPSTSCRHAPGGATSSSSIRRTSRTSSRLPSRPRLARSPIADGGAGAAAADGGGADGGAAVRRSRRASSSRAGDARRSRKRCRACA